MSSDFTVHGAKEKYVIQSLTKTGVFGILNHAD